MPGKLPETGFLYTDQQGTLFRFIGTSRHWQTMEELLIFQAEEENVLYAVPVSDFTKEFQKAENGHTSDLLLRFLEAESNEEKLSILQKNRPEVTEDFLEAAAQSMDYTLSGDSEEMQFLDFENYIRTKIKYERKRR
nr:hypothetical protein [uncultured Sellimonas sp.]